MNHGPIALILNASILDNEIHTIYHDSAQLLTKPSFCLRPRLRKDLAEKVQLYEAGSFVLISSSPLDAAFSVLSSAAHTRGAGKTSPARTRWLARKARPLFWSQCHLWLKTMPRSRETLTKGPLAYDCSLKQHQEKPSHDTQRSKRSPMKYSLRWGHGRFSKSTNQ